MITGTYAKQPYEVETLKVAWALRISSLNETGYAISAVEVKIYTAAGVDVTTTMLSGTASYSGTDVFFTVQAGTDGLDYYARIRVTLSKAGSTTLYQEEDLLIRVRQVGS